MRKFELDLQKERLLREEKKRKRELQREKEIRKHELAREKLRLQDKRESSSLDEGESPIQKFELTKSLGILPIFTVDGVERYFISF